MNKSIEYIKQFVVIYLSFLISFNFFIFILNLVFKNPADIGFFGHFILSIKTYLYFAIIIFLIFNTLTKIKYMGLFKFDSKFIALSCFLNQIFYQAFWDFHQNLILYYKGNIFSNFPIYLLQSIEFIAIVIILAYIFYLFKLDIKSNNEK